MHASACSPRLTCTSPPRAAPPPASPGEPKLTEADDADATSAAGPAAALLPARKLHLFVWAQCDKCSKWRRLPPGHDDMTLSRGF